MGLIPMATALAFLSACASTPDTDDPDPVHATPAQVEQGRQMAERMCGSCHAAGRRGSSPMRDAQPLRALSGDDPVSSLAEAFSEGIITGYSNMPEFTLDPEEITALLGYLDSIQTRRRSR